MNNRHHPQTSPVLLGLVLLGGCTGNPNPGPGVEKHAPAETRLALEIPAGLAVSVDGELKGNAPLGPLVVSPGKHALEVEGPCGTASAAVDASAGALTTVRAADFADLKLARLTVVAKKLDGTALSPSVSLRDWAVPGAAGVQALIPACKLRLTVTSEGLGGFIEEIEFEAGKSYVRDVVLAPGPDMVRIHGGHFRMGPPGPNLYDPSFDRDEAYEDFEGWPWIKLYEVDVPTFEIDRTEVTAEQFRACYEAGYCSRPVLFAGSTSPPEHHDKCNTDVITRELKGGSAAHPANCVASWEAMKYCEWVGKRLPTELEWEYAARSGNLSYACSWGGTASPKVNCDRRLYPEAGMKPVCSYPEDNTDQGLCDMMGNVAEMVTYTALPGRPALTDCRDNVVTRGVQWGGNTVPFLPHSCVSMRQDDTAGFRCARDSMEVAAQGWKDGVRGQE